MATFVLIHGAADTAWYWHLVEPELRERGHEVVTMDLPCDDDSAGLAEYADAVVEAIGDRKDLVDVPREIAAEALRRVRDQSETPGQKPWPLGRPKELADRLEAYLSERRT